VGDLPDLVDQALGQMVAEQLALASVAISGACAQFHDRPMGRDDGTTCPWALAA